MQTVVHIKAGIWGALAALVFLLTLAAFFMWMAFGFGLNRPQGEIGIVPLCFSILFALGCFLVLDDVRRPKQKLLAIKDGHLFWRITDGKSGRTLSEKNLLLGSIRALKWVSRKPGWKFDAGCRIGFPRLVFVTTNGHHHELPGEFFAASYRKKIETALQQNVPAIQILKAFE